MSLISCDCGYVEEEGRECRKCDSQARIREDKDAPPCWSYGCGNLQIICKPLTGFCKDCTAAKDAQAVNVQDEITMECQECYTECGESICPKCKQLEEDNKECAQWHYQRGCVKKVRLKYEEALKSFKAAADLCPDDKHYQKVYNNYKSKKE